MSSAGPYILPVFWIIIQVTSMLTKRGLDMSSAIFIRDCSSADDPHLTQLYEDNKYYSNYFTLKTHDHCPVVSGTPGFFTEASNVLEMEYIYRDGQSSNVSVNSKVFHQIDKFTTSEKNTRIDVEGYPKPKELLRISAESSRLENDIRIYSEDAGVSIAESDTFFLHDNDLEIRMESAIDSHGIISTYKKLRCKRDKQFKTLRKNRNIFSEKRKYKAFSDAIWTYPLAELIEIPVKSYWLSGKMKSKNLTNFSGNYVLDVMLLGREGYGARFKQIGIFSSETLACARSVRNVQGFCHDPRRSVCNECNPHCTLLFHMHVKDGKCRGATYREETFFIMQSACSLIIFELTKASYNEKIITAKDKLLSYRTRVLLTSRRWSNSGTIERESIKKDCGYPSQVKSNIENQTLQSPCEMPSALFGNKTTVVDLKLGLSQAALMLNQLGYSVSGEGDLVKKLREVPCVQAHVSYSMQSTSRIQRQLKSLFPSQPSNRISIINREETVGAGSKSLRAISRLSLIESRYKASSAAMPFTATVNRVTEATESDDFTAKEASTKWQTTRITDQYFRPLLRTEGGASARTIFPGREEIMLEIDEITVPEETETTANYSGGMTAVLVAESGTPEIKEFDLRDHKADRNLRAIVVKDVEYTSSPITGRTLNNGLPISESHYQWQNSPRPRYGLPEKMENGNGHNSENESKTMFGESANSSTRTRRDYSKTKLSNVSQDRDATLILDEYDADNNVPEIINEEFQGEETSKESVSSTTSDSNTSTFTRLMGNENRSEYFPSVLNGPYNSGVNAAQTDNASDIDSALRKQRSASSKFPKFFLGSLNTADFPKSELPLKDIDVLIANNGILEDVTEDLVNYDLDDSTGRILPPCSRNNNYGKNTPHGKDRICDVGAKLNVFEDIGGRNLSVEGKLFTLRPTSSKKSGDDIPVNISRSNPHVTKIENNQQWMPSVGEIRNWLSRKSSKPSGSLPKKDEGGDSIGTYVKLYFTKKLSVLKMLPTPGEFFCQHDNAADSPKTDFVERKEEEWLEKEVVKISDRECLRKQHYLFDCSTEFVNTSNILHRPFRRTEIDRKIIDRDMTLISLIESQRLNAKQKDIENPGKTHYQVYHVFRSAKPTQKPGLNKIHRRGDQANVATGKWFEKEGNQRKISEDNLKNINRWNRRGRKLLSMTDSDEIRTGRSPITDKSTNNERFGNVQLTRNNQKINSAISDYQKLQNKLGDGDIKRIVQTVPGFGGSGYTHKNSFTTPKHRNLMNVRKKRSSAKFEDLGRNKKSLAIRDYYLRNKDAFQDAQEHLRNRLTRSEHPNRRDIMFSSYKNGRGSHKLFRTNPHISMIKVIPIRLVGVLPFVKSNVLPVQAMKKLNDGKTSLEKIYGSPYNRNAGKSFPVEISPRRKEDEDEEKLSQDPGYVLLNGHASAELSSFNNVSNYPHESDSVTTQGTTEPSRTPGSIVKESDLPVRLSFATRKQTYRLSTENVTIIPSLRNNSGEQRSKSSEGYTRKVENELRTKDVEAAGGSPAKTYKNTDVGQLSSTEYSVVNMPDRTLTEFPDENQDTWKNIKPAVLPSPGVTVRDDTAVCVEQKPEYTKCEIIKASDRDCSKGEKVHNSNILAMTECTKELRRVVSESEGQSNKVDEMAMHVEDVVFLPKPDKTLIDHKLADHADCVPSTNKGLYCKNSGMIGKHNAAINNIDVQNTQNSVASPWNRRNAPNEKLRAGYELYDKQRRPFLWDNFSLDKTELHNKRDERKATLRKKKKKRRKKSRGRRGKKVRRNRNSGASSRMEWSRQRRQLLSIFEDVRVLTPVSRNRMKYEPIRHETRPSGRFNEQIRPQDLQVNIDKRRQGPTTESILSGKLSAKIEKENYETKVELAVQGFQWKWRGHARETSLKDEAFGCYWTQDAVYSVSAGVYVSEGRRRFNVTCHQERLESKRLGYYPSNFVFVWKEAIEQGMGGNGSCESLVLKCHSAHVSILGSVPVASHYNATFRYQRVRGEPHLRNRNCDSLMRCFPHRKVYCFIWEKPRRSSVNSILDDKNLCKFFCLEGNLQRAGKYSLARRRSAQKMNFCSFRLLHCFCAYLSAVNGLVCKPISPGRYPPEDISKVKCDETAYFMNTVKDVLIFSAILILFLLLLGILKGLIGLFVPRIARWGLDSLVENRKMDECNEPESKCRSVTADKSRAPVHPDTGTKCIRVSSRLQFLLNVVFFLTYPVAVCYACVKYFVGSKERQCRPEKSEGKVKSRNQSNVRKSVDVAAEKFVNDLLSQRLVFRNLSKPIGDLDIPSDVVYSLRGYFMISEDGGYLFATPCPFKQYWTFESNGEKKSIDPPRVYQSSLFTRIFNSVTDVYESNEVTFIPNGICINVQFPDVE